MIPQALFEKTLRQFFAPIAPYFDDATITEILVNGPGEVIVERAGTLHKTQAHFRDGEELLAAIRHLAQFVGRRVDAQCPILEGRMPDGSRVEAVLPPRFARWPPSRHSTLFKRYAHDGSTHRAGRAQRRRRRDAASSGGL